MKSNFKIINIIKILLTLNFLPDLILLAVFLPALVAGNWTPTCKFSNIGILYPDYSDSRYFYKCVNVNDVAHTKCGTVNGVQQLFVYVYQACTKPDNYISPPPSSQIDSEINGGNSPGPSPTTTPTLPTPKEDSTTPYPETTTTPICDTSPPSPTAPQPETPDQSTPPGPVTKSTTQKVPMPETPKPTPPGPQTPPTELNTPPIRTTSPKVPQPNGR